MNKEILPDIKIATEIIKIRISQMLINEVYKTKGFQLSAHLAMGHEAIAVAIKNIIFSEDKLLLSHRNIEYNLAFLESFKPILDEYLLETTGLTQGNLGSMNLINKDRNIIYSSSILGNNFAVTTGVAMAQELEDSKGITFVFGGDGSIEEGAFYEGLLMLKSLNLPALVIIENNEWSLGTRIEERRCHIDVKKLTDSMNITHAYLAGNDVYKYIHKLKELRKESLDTKSPICIEIKVATLGDRFASQTPEYPNGRLINYHSGPAVAINLQEWPLLKENVDDPIFVLKKYFNEDQLKAIAKQIYTELKAEIKTT